MTERTVVAFYDANRAKIGEVDVPEETVYIAWAPEGTLRIITYGEVAAPVGNPLAEMWRQAPKVADIRKLTDEGSC